MAVQHAGNMSNQIQFEEHDGVLNAKRVVSAATIFAVVNTSAGGNVTVQQGTDPWNVAVKGNVTLSDSKSFIGLTTTTLGASPAFIGIVTITNKDRTITGNVTLSDSKGFIGLTTTTLGNSPAFVGIVTVTNRDMTLNGNVTLSDAKTFIGLTTTTLGASPAFIGIVTVANPSAAAAGNVTLNPSPNFIGIVTVANPSSFTGNVTLDPGSRTGILGNVTLSDAKTYIGLTTTTLGAGDRFIGLVTAVTRNAGTNKTLTVLPVTLSTASILNLVTATNTWKMTSLLLNSNATVRVNIKSGATYLTGNASLGINLNPGGGWVETGAPDAPIYFALAASQTLTIEKSDYSGVISQIGGKVVYFDE